MFRVLLLTTLTPVVLYLCYLLWSILISHFHGSPSNRRVIVTVFDKNSTTSTSTKEPSIEKDDDDDDEDDLHLQYRFIYTFLLDLVAMLLLLYLVIVPLIIYCFTTTLVRFALFPAIGTDIALKVSKRNRFVGVQEFYLQFRSATLEDEGEESTIIKLGVWYIPPQDEAVHQKRPQKSSGGEETETETEHSSSENIFGPADQPGGRLVFLLAHGNSGDRSQAKPQMRMLARKLGCHVVAFDYRGYADSSQEVAPTPDGLEEDLFAVYSWIVFNCRVPASRVVLWGHSLGGAVILRMLARLPKSAPSAVGGTPLAAILESTFSSLHDELAAFPLLRPFRCLPHFELCIREPITSNRRLNFDSVALLPKVHCPLLFLHALDDNVIPFRLGLKLYEAARELQPPEVAKRAKMVDFPASLGCGHKGIGAREEMKKIISEFILQRVLK